MAAGDQRAQRRQAAVYQHPVPYQRPAERWAAREADPEADEYQQYDQPRHESPDACFLRQCFQFRDGARGVRHAFRQCRLGAGQMPGAEHREDMPPRLVAQGLDQLGRHVAVAFGDQWLVDLAAILGELGEGGVEHVAFLQRLDLLLGDLLTRQHRCNQRAEQPHALPPGHVRQRALQCRADITIDAQQLQTALLGLADRGTLLGPRLDVELLGKSLLKSAQRQLPGDQRRLALTHDLE